MSTVYLKTIALVFLSILVPFQKEGGWNGIVPLHSTRAEVEHLLGRSADKCNCIYKTQNETIYVEYAEAKCKGYVAGWNVPRDTVLRLTVRSKAQRHFSEVKIDLNKYRIRRDDTFTKYYSSRDEGVEYSVSPEGIITSVSYVPSKKDNNLRCPGFPVEDGSLTDYQPFDEYGDLTFNDESARLDPFVIMLDQLNLDGYIVTYAGKSACPGEAKTRAIRAKNYLVKKRNFDPKRIKAIDGGNRDRFSVELYGIPRNADPPTAVPTISSNEVKLIRNRKCRDFRLK